MRPDVIQRCAAAWSGLSRGLVPGVLYQLRTRFVTESRGVTHAIVMDHHARPVIACGKTLTRGRGRFQRPREVVSCLLCLAVPIEPDPRPEPWRRWSAP